MGCLETLLHPAATSKWPPLVPCVDAYWNCIGPAGRTANQESKIKLRALLAAAYPKNPNLTLVKIWDDSDRFAINRSGVCSSNSRDQEFLLASLGREDSVYFARPNQTSSCRRLPVLFANARLRRTVPDLERITFLLYGP